MVSDANVHNIFGVREKFPQDYDAVATSLKSVIEKEI